MQRKKVYSVSLYFDLHAITCPGVWLCPKGKVAVRVAIFGVSEVTKLLPPAFPLNFHERFHFQKRYKKASNLYQVESILHRVPVCLELLQCPQGISSAVKLAEFRACVGDIINPPGGDVDLLFCPTKTFPGIIAPKAEVSTRLALTDGGVIENTSVPTTVFSKGTKSRKSEEPVIRQKPVCHTKHYLYCSCFDKDAQVFTKVFKKRKEILDKMGPSQEVYRKVSPAHKLSHRNHGDYNLECYEDKFDGGGGRFPIDQQTGFQNGFEQHPYGISEETSVTGEVEKNGLPLETEVAEQYFQNCLANKTHQAELEQQVNEAELHHKPGSCCYCCPKASNDQSNKHDPCTLLNKNAPKKSRVPKEQKNGLETKKHSCCPCSHCTHLMEIFRKQSVGNKGCEDGDNFYNILRKAYQNLLQEYYYSPVSGLKAELMGTS